jgi:hypothetical protein
MTLTTTKPRRTPPVLPFDRDRASTGPIRRPGAIVGAVEQAESTPKGRMTAHAHRILALGHRRANTLLRYAKLRACWSHVDWKAVERGLAQ